MKRPYLLFAQVSANEGGYSSWCVLTVVGDKLMFEFKDDSLNAFCKGAGKPHV
jgi:hypothetical protein